ncbi:hypothetical protein [Agromyces archimandritae]|uniref:Uncharacterized protein n=1 Tax=Agromyces archimandritae TaxID=2781962 RepID=A0A975FK72_9MICO|nr:hypothetical protein [Agromyces archimandritae]QTX03565.1 hypothetical protein G127AT_09400 [Agromyces archimandritae]
MNTSPSLRWQRADHEVHSATLDGEYAGHVVADGAAFTAYDRIGRKVARRGTLRGAQRALDAAARRSARMQLTV